MMNQKSVLILVGLLFVVGLLVFWGVASDPVPDVDSPESLVLYSIDGRMGPPDSVERNESFRGYPVWGKVDVDDAELRREVIRRVERSIVPNGPMAACFWPRHGISVTENGKQIEFVICFKCNQVKIYRGEESETLPLSIAEKAYFNRLLADNGIELVPEGKSR